jgi:asparagine synthase (glutamine-hydrolysing)
MCGIFGTIRLASSISYESLTNQRDLLTHRGPDDAGLWISPDNRVGLGQRRLSIIDLSPKGHQPMILGEGRFVIVFNGEIYNHQHIRKTLQAEGILFTSNSDTEVLLAAYIAWGEDCLIRLNGMFAFAIYDRGTINKSPTLFFARDRAGEKPFYYSQTKDNFSFSSELKALNHSGQINLQALNYYLSLGYVPSDMCLFEGVQKLAPAHCGILNLSSGALEIRRYWALPSNQPKAMVDGADLAAEAGALIQDSVRLRLVADVPVGVLLSGGLDSSLVVAAAARVSSSPVETFTISLPGSSLDEAHHAQKVASFFGTRHHVLPLATPSLDLLDSLEPYIDEPIADSSILPAWLVFGLARKQVTVALGGDGGDELFGGYSDYTTSISDDRLWGGVPKQLMRAIAGAASLLPAGVRGRNRIASLRGGAFQQLIWGRPYFDSLLRRRLLTVDAAAELGAGLEAPERFLLDLFHQGVDPIDSMTRTHFGSILPDDFLVKVDRASMMHSLEVRAPFLDHRLIEFAFRQVPSHWKVQGNESRRLERLLAQQWLPPDLDTNRKQGFSIPINEWLRNEGEDGLMGRMTGLPDVINLDEVRSLVRGHIAGRANGGRIFALIMLAIAMRNATIR